MPMAYTIEHKLVESDPWHRIEPWDYLDLFKAHHQAHEYLYRSGGEVRIVSNGRVIMTAGIAKWIHEGNNS